MTVTSIRDAWAEVRKIFPTDYEYSTERSERVGYPIYHSKASGVNAWISDLGNRLEINLPDGESANIWIQAPGGGHHQQQHQEHRGNRGHRERNQRGAARNRKANPAPCVLLHRGLCPRDGQQKARGRRSERNAGRRNGGVHIIIAALDRGDAGVEKDHTSFVQVLQKPLPAAFVKICCHNSLPYSEF